MFSVALVAHDLGTAVFLESILHFLRRIKFHYVVAVIYIFFVTGETVPTELYDT